MQIAPAGDVALESSVPKTLETALQHHQAGRLREAEELYRRILEREPDHPDALHYLGVIAYQTGRYATAVEHMGRAIAANPSNALYYNNLGNTLKEQGKFDEALSNYQQALAYQPDYALAHNNLGLLFHQQGKLNEAVASFRQALTCKPDYSAAHNNLGNVLKDQGRLDEAAACYREALAFKPDFAMAYSNLGVVLKDQGRLDESISNFRRALALKPDDAKAHNNLGNALNEQGRFGEAIASYHKAIAFKPDDAQAHNNLGNALKELDRLEDAIASYRKALSLKPDFAEAHSNLGFVLWMQCKLDDAVASLRKALSLKPDDAGTYRNLLFVYGYQVLLDPQEYLALACGWEQACVPALERQDARDRTFKRAPLTGRRLKVGYVSGDYRQHAVGYFVEQLFTHHDRERIELFAYSTHGQRDDTTMRFESLAEHWVPLVGRSDTAMRERIAADNIDVLIDLSGHTAHNRLDVFARRAAPVQAHYLGYFASTGLTEMDYWIGDDIITPAETDSHFSEQVWRLPRTWVSYAGGADAPVPDWRPAADGAVWMGSFNNLNKLTPATLALWAKVLHALPEGRLLLKTMQLADAGNRQRILDAFTAHGIASNRIELQDGSSTPAWTSHMGCYDRLDIALDPAGAVGGGTTTCDALWMGAPLVALAGDRMASRMTASMLDALGHPEWIAQSEAGYIDKVVALARNVELRKNLRATQRSRMAQCPLCNGRDLAIHLENAYLQMFERWLDGKMGRSN